MAITEQPSFDRLTGSMKVEVAVVGGGIAGLSAALDLAKRGHCVTLLEAETIGYGATGRSGGDMSPGFSASIGDVIKRCGESTARTLFDLTLLGQKVITGWIEEYSIICDHKATGSLRCAKRGVASDLERYRDRVAKVYGLELEVWSAARLRAVLETESYSSALYNPLTICLNPLDLAYGLARAVERIGGRIFTGSKVVKVHRNQNLWKIQTKEGVVSAEHVVHTVGGYPNFGNQKKIWFATVPVTTCMIVTDSVDGRLGSLLSSGCAVSDIDDPPNYYRISAGDRLMWGGMDSITEPSESDLKSALRQEMLSIFPQLRDIAIRQAWTGRMAFLRHFMPFVGQVGPNAWCATGFGGLGLAMGALSGTLLGAGISDGDDTWRQFERFGLPFAGGALARPVTRFGFLRKVLSE